MKIAVLGGRFDPPHLGHFLIAQQALELKPDIEKILFVPSYKHPWKDIVASSNDRVAMLQASLSEEMEVGTTDIDNKEEFTINTLRRIRNEFGNKIYWIIGSDIVSEFSRWKDYKELTKLATFLVFPRDPYSLPKELPKGFELINSESLLTTNISSTIIRQRVKMGKSIKYLVPREVSDYIKFNNLYE